MFTPVSNFNVGNNSIIPAGTDSVISNMGSINRNSALYGIVKTAEKGRNAFLHHTNITSLTNDMYHSIGNGLKSLFKSVERGE